MANTSPLRVRSVFDMVPQPPAPAKPARKMHPPIDLAALQIKSGVPIPKVLAPREARDRSRALLDRMKAGDMVELTHVQARSVRAAAKKLGVSVLTRRIGPAVTGLWRLA